METYRLHFMASRRPDGSFASTPTDESRSMRSNTDQTLGDPWTTPTYVLILSLERENLPLLMGDRDDAGRGRAARPRAGGG